MSALPAAISGSTVHRGGHECEVDDCLPDSQTTATSSAWRIRDGRTATWICCDRHLAGFRSVDGVGQDERLGIERWLYLPLLSPDDPYARIAVEELCYALAAFGAACRARVRVDPHPRCGYDVFIGKRFNRTPCRKRATQAAVEWFDEGGDLPLCDRHAKALKRAERSAGGELWLAPVLDFGGGR